MEGIMEQQGTARTDTTNAPSDINTINSFSANADTVVQLPNPRSMEIRNGRLVIQILPLSMTDLCNGVCDNCGSSDPACIGGCLPCTLTVTTA
jgi:hypothetical protein